MTSQIPDNHAWIADLLPAYLNGQLEAVEARQVRRHLLSCANCQQELAAWEAIKGTTRHVLAATPLPSLGTMDAVWTKIDAPAEQAQFLRPWSPGRALYRLWLVFRFQIPLISKSIWTASALVCFFGLALSLFMGVFHRHNAFAGQLLVLFIVVAGASGCGFICGSTVDPGFEWTIATPTSMRLLMLYRMLLVVGYNLLLGCIASVVFASFNGLGLWEMVQLWVGPLFFFSSLCLTVSLYFGSVFALILTAAVEVIQNFSANLSGHMIDLSLSSLPPKFSGPALLIGALLLLICAVWFVPRQPRMAS